ncbi:NAD-dependent DNA ligase LigA [Lachnospira eligens]|jgi:DNA ligase (NAD+)|uniref:DNA ligase n=1 Tax=Lachnospira eligens TaxID=39485 RepID=A0A415ME28_9FIRM|nr:NAD-dependent DNA ligase LigA [Lachnospira eligens]RHA50568.1 NAD-dependent DNA ligase LigA [Lachnospira eligens]RHL71025.1 NAD-dependent DNA ligase LigA [Lachnospira eligens]
MDKLERIKQLIKDLNNASYAYYNQVPIMPDYEWDKMYDELINLEEETGIVLFNSPTHNVGYSISDELKEVKHNHPMLSLDKTKSVDELIEFLGDKNGFLSVKCDGLTTSLHYINGKLIGAETRGNGVKGTECLQNVLTMKNVPREIPYKDELIIDGETIIGWDTFREINDKLPEDKKYKHPRNLVSGSLQLLNSKEAASRNMRFVAWRVIKGFEHKSVFFDLKRAESNGFEIVPMWSYSNNSSDKENLSKMLEDLRYEADFHNIPYDGAVMAVDDYKIAESMGRTDKYFRHSKAYKYEDELFETVLTDIEWNTSKTGLINPVAIFEPVDLNGAITTRATLHNVTYIKDMMLGIGDRIRVYRSNMVIPKVHDSIDKSGNFNIPDKCPICGQPTRIIKENDSEVLICENPDCKGKLLGRLVHAASRNALDIENLSESTIEKFINLGWLNSIQDMYHLSDHENEMKTLDGFGKKSVEKLLNSIEKSRKTTLDRFLFSLSVPLLGKSASQDIAENCTIENTSSIGNFMQIMITDGAEHFRSISGIGDSLINSLNSYFNIHCSEIFELSKEFKFESPNIVLDEIPNTLQGKTFVVTGSVHHYKNRDELKADIVTHGGTVVGSVSSKTSYLINNDINSASSKNQKAKSLNIPIISEEEFLQMIIK